MTIDDRLDLLPFPYAKGTWDGSQASLPGFLLMELDRLERALKDAHEAAPQVSDVEPSNPRRGTIRYAVAPWDPLGTGNAWVWWNGTAWVAL